MIWFTSDTHFGHKNIIKYCNRPFYSVEEMDECIISNWNNKITDTDIVYHLGDFSFHSKEKTIELFSRLKGQKFLIFGNHDHSRTKNLDWNKVYQEYQFTFEDIRIHLRHYPREIRYSGNLYFHGHSHGGRPKEKRALDVGVDCHNFSPISLLEALEKCNE